MLSSSISPVPLPTSFFDKYMLTPSMPGKMKVCYPLCFKLQIPLIDQESFPFPLFLLNRTHLLSSKMGDKFSYHWICNGLPTPLPQQRSTGGKWGSAFSSRQGHTRGAGPALCQHSWLCTALCLLEPLTTCTKWLFLIYRFALSCGNIAMVVCCSWLEFWGMVTSPHTWRTHMN